MPHSPFFYDNKCNFVNNQYNKKNWTNGYKMNYLCSLKRIREFQNYILSKDKKAIVVIQGDHGYFFKDKEVLEDRNDISTYVRWMYENDKDELIKNYSTFNLVKNDYCKLPKNIELDNVNSILFTLNCALDLNLEYKKKKTYLILDEKIRQIDNR